MQIMAQQSDSLAGVLTSVAEARGLPNAHYVDPAVFEEERNALLLSQWSGVGFASPASGTSFANPTPDH